MDYLTPFLDRGADIEEPDSYGMTPLACTTEHDHSKSAAVLLKYGANINTRCNDGWTPLLRAINSNSYSYSWIAGLIILSARLRMKRSYTLQLEGAIWKR